MNEWLDIVSNVGFPIAMVAYFIFRFEKIIKSNTEMIQALYNYIKMKV